MADITSSTYKVVTDSKAGDQYAVVRDGQLVKQTRAGLTPHTTAQAVAELRIGGTTANRPGAPDIFTNYFDTTLNKPIWWNGMNWVDATGLTV